MFRLQQSHHQGFKVTFTSTFTNPFGITTLYTTMYVKLLLAVNNNHCFGLYNNTISFKCLGVGFFHI
jgi:hypothetical protein